MSCPVCFGGDDPVVRDGLTAGIGVLVSITLIVLGCFARFFVSLARRSRDIGSAQQGGDLDWATPDTYVKEFSEAMVGLQKGRFTEKPVRTQFGYHVIRLDDVRTVTPPPVSQVSPQIRQDLERARVDKLQQSLRAKAKVQ